MFIYNFNFTSVWSGNGHPTSRNPYPEDHFYKATLGLLVILNNENEIHLDNLNCSKRHFKQIETVEKTLPSPASLEFGVAAS